MTATRTISIDDLERIATFIQSASGAQATLTKLLAHEADREGGEALSAELWTTMQRGFAIETAEEIVSEMMRPNFTTDSAASDAVN